MAVVTIYRLAEEIKALLDGGNPPAASSISYNEIKISIGQVCNALLKVEHFTINEKMNERIPNGSVLGWYDGISVYSSNGKSKCSLPIKPLKLPRNMGVFSIYPKYNTDGNYELDKEFIPLQMGQAGLLKSQPMINDILGQVGYETFGGEIIFTKDIKALFPDVVLAIRLVIMDISQYSDTDILPILPEQEWQIKETVYKMYSTQPIPDKVIDSTVKENKGIPLAGQKQT